MEPTTPEEKLRRARTMLILGDGDEPFFGSIAMGLDLVENPVCRTASTDGKELWFNPDWIMTLDAEEAMALFEHEVLHVAFKHGTLILEVMDEPDFDIKLWQHACDHPINSILIKKGRKLPPRAIYDPRFDGMSAIRIYRTLLNEKKSLKPPDKNQCDGTPPKITPDDMVEETGDFGGIVPLLDEDKKLASQEKLEEMQRTFEMTVMNSARILQKTLGSKHSDLPGFVRDIIESHTEPQRSYKDDILDIMEEITRDDFSWSRPNKKYDIYMPSMYDKVFAELVVIVDSSGSVSRRELEIYAGEVSGILQEFEGLQIHVIFHTNTAYKVKTFQDYDLPVTFGQLRSGSTCYRDAYKRIEDEGFDPKVILHFTDLDVKKHNYPDSKPDFPVFWMNTTPRKSNGALRYSKPPWGKVIDLDPYV